MENQAAFLALVGNMQSCAAVKPYAMLYKLFKIGRKNLAKIAIRQSSFSANVFYCMVQRITKRNSH